MFDVSPEEAREIAKKSFRWAGTNAREGYEEDDNMLTSSGQNWITYGSVMGPWIENAGVGKSKVTVISKKKSVHTDSYWYDRWKAS